MRSFSKFLQGVAKVRSGGETARDGAMQLAEMGCHYVSKALGENRGQAGGYIIPLDFTTDLMGCIEEESFVWPRATVIEMASKETLAPKIDVETVPSATGVSALVSGISMTWGSDQAPVETEPLWRQLALTAWDLLGNCVVSNQFLWDLTENGAEHLMQLFARAAAWYSEFAFMQGLGAAGQMPLGIVQAGINGTCAFVTRHTSGAHVTINDIQAMAGNLLPGSWKTAVWACNPLVVPQIVGLTSSYFINDGHETDASGRMGLLLGRPLYVTDTLPALGTPGDLVFFDPRLYTIGLRQEIVVDASPHVLFSTNQTMFRLWMRLDGKPQVSNIITLQDKSTTVSPYVVLN